MGKKIANILKGELVSSISYILLGICLAFMPVQTVNIICKLVFGLVLIGAGIYHIYIYIIEKEDSTILDLFSGVIVLVLGGFLFFNPQIVVKLLPLFLGAFVLVDSIWTFRGSFRLKKRGRKEWKAFLVSSFICVGFGIAMVLNPFSKVRQTVMFAGWVFLCNGVADIVFFILLKRGIKKSENMQNSVTTADIQQVQQEQESTKNETAQEEQTESMAQENNRPGMMTESDETETLVLETNETEPMPQETLPEETLEEWKD